MMESETISSLAELLLGLCSGLRNEQRCSRQKSSGLSQIGWKGRVRAEKEAIGRPVADSWRPGAAGNPAERGGFWLQRRKDGGWPVVFGGISGIL